MDIQNLKINDIAKAAGYKHTERLSMIMHIFPGGTNTTMFTDCCQTAITEYEDNVLCATEKFMVTT